MLYLLISPGLNPRINNSPLMKIVMSEGLFDKDKRIEQVLNICVRK